MDFTTQDYHNLAIAVSVVVSPLIAYFGWRRQKSEQLASHEREKEKEIQMELRQKRIARLEAQISEYYAPIYALRKQTEAAHAVYRKHMPTKANSEGVEEIIEGEMTPEYHRVIHDYIMFDFLIPYNTEITKIIKTKSHLLENDEFDVLFKKYLAHVSEFEIVKNLNIKHNIDAHMSQGTFPSMFTQKIEGKLNELRKEYTDLLGKVK